MSILITILFQILLLGLLFSDSLVTFPKIFVHFLWWATILFGLISGVKNYKKNINLSVLSIILSFSMTALMLLMIAITSM